MWRPAPCFGWKKFRRSQFFSFIHSLFLAFLMLTRGRLVRGPETRNRNHLKAICQIMCLFPCEQAKRVFKTRKVDACVWFPIPLIKKGYTTTERHLSQQKDPEDPFWNSNHISEEVFKDWIVGQIKKPLSQIPLFVKPLNYILLSCDPEKAMAPHSSTLAWKIPRTEEPGRLRSMGSLRVGHDWATSLSLSLSCIGEGNGNPLQCSCLENPRDRGAWWADVCGVAQSRTRLKWLSSSSSSKLRPWEK